MIALGMIVRHELLDCVLKRCRSEEEHPAQNHRTSSSSGLAHSPIASFEIQDITGSTAGDTNTSG
jgi:hypothetical protein